MFPAEQVKQFIVATIIPLITGSAVTWIAGTKVLAILHISTGSAAQAISGVLLFGLSYALAWLTSHHILSGKYTPAAKASVNR